MKNILITMVLVLASVFLAKAQEINAQFGKNRVQYSDDYDTWYRYETENFITYWYGKSKNVAISSLQLAEYDFSEIQNILEHRINEKIELIIYGDIGELYQTNIGLSSIDPVNLETVQLVGTKLFVHFDGNHKNLRDNIREGIAKVYIYSMLFGSSFQEIVQNTFMSDMPEWFKAGIIDYAKNKWTEEDDAQLRYFMHGKRRPYKNFRKLSKHQPVLAGKAFWYFLAENYGTSSISNIIYLTRINRSVKSAFRYVLGDEFDDVTKDCYEYYKERYNLDSENFEAPRRKGAFAQNSYGSEYLNMKLSPDGTHLAYVTNKNGRYKIIVQNTETKKKQKLRSAGYNNPYRITDKNYPILFWSTDGESLGYIYERRDILQLRIENLRTGELYKNTLNPVFNRVYSASFIDDKNIMFSGNTNGYSDLYTYNLNKRIEENVTADFYDDLDASICEINDIQGILFSSNRDKTDIIPEDIDTTLSIKSFDLYFLPLNDRSQLYRLTRSEFADEFESQVTGNTLSFITDKYGLETVISHEIDSKFKLSKKFSNKQLTSNIISKSCSDSHCYYSTNYNKRSLLLKSTLSDTLPKFTSFQKKLLQEAVKGPLLIEEEEVPLVDDTEDIPEGWFFQTEFDDTPEKSSEEVAISIKQNNSLYQEDRVHRFNTNRTTAARLRFKILDMSSNLDNEPLFTGLNSYAGERNNYQSAPLGLLMKMKVGDAFEDYVFEGGMRFATNFSGYEMFMTFENRKHQWDHTYGAYFRSRSDRRIDQINQLLDRNEDKTYLGYYQIKYPFDEFQSLRLSGTLRSDTDYTLITNSDNFNSPVTTTQRVGLRLEYVYDNSSQRSLNIFHGSRSKFFVEAMNRFRLQLADPFILEPSNGTMTIIGLDSRYYLPIFEKSVLAARISAGTSLGSERTLFYVGGVERALLPGFDQSTGIPNKNFAFDNIAPQLRGFERNIRNGTSYIVSTVELRVPIFRHLFSDQIRYAFLREFQVVAFFDSGTAWHGISPYDAANPINSATFESGESVILNVQYFRDPLVLGYGYGFRTSLFGYFVKLDYAYGIETRATLSPRIHISLGTDF